MRGSRRFSQAISEGDGISLIADVASPGAAAGAAPGGAEAILVRAEIAGLREATELPILFVGAGGPGRAAAADADACVVTVEGLEAEDGGLEREFEDAAVRGLDCAVAVHDEDELQLALDRLDPEILVLSGRHAEGHAGLEHVLGLLPDVPAGKLVVADLDVTAPETVEELERAGFDAVVVTAAGLQELAGDSARRPGSDGA